MMARASRKFAIPYGAQFPAQGLLGDRHAELLEYPLTEIDKPPTHDAVNRRDRAILDHLRDRRPVLVVQSR